MTDEQHLGEHITRSGGETSITTDTEGRRVYTALAYDTTSLDRHGTTMTNDALKLAPGGAPVLLFHKSDAFPVGKVIGFSAGPMGPEAQFVLHAETEEARTAQALVDAGFLRGVSVGFIPRTAEFREEDGAIVYTDAELVELSLTPTPSSRLALVDLKRSIDDLLADEAPAVEPACCEGDCNCGPVEEAREVEDIESDVAPEEAATEDPEVRSYTVERLARVSRLG